jgi:hypothetical protein
MNLSREVIEDALSLLGQLLDATKSRSYGLVVCGGSALLAKRIVTRVTHDVDLIALRDLDGEIFDAYPLPHELKEAAESVAAELDLESDWLNSAAAFHLPGLHALPPFFWQDLDSRRYGERLSVSYLGRSGQILLKFYAALNRAEARDLDDLQALGPNEQETIATLHWIFAHVPILSHRHQLSTLLTHLGHDLLIDRYKV